MRHKNAKNRAVTPDNAPYPGKRKKMYDLVFTGSLLSLAVALSFLESLLPPLPFLPFPGIRLGLANVTVMYSLLFLGFNRTIPIVLAKSVFVFLTRGFIAFTLSISGSMLSIITMMILLVIGKNKISYSMLSVTGAVSHNIGQIIMIYCLYFYGGSLSMLLFYLPLLLVSGVVTGLANAIILKISIPLLEKFPVSDFTLRS